MFLCLRIIFNDYTFVYFHLLAPLTSSPAPCTPPAPPASPPRAPPTAHSTCTSSQHILATTEAKPTCQTHRRASDFKWSQELDHWFTDTLDRSSNTEPDVQTGERTSTGEDHLGAAGCRKYAPVIRYLHLAF